ncbi:MAG: GntR family transcriptional regulator [Acinetobacter sp.]
MSSNVKKNQEDLAQDAIDTHIYHAIVDAILNRQLTAGTRLVEAPLCQAFGVTRGVLRRAFVKLAHDNVIEIQPNRGALIAQYSAEEMREVFEARSMLEIATVRKLAQKASQIDFSPLHTLVEQEAQQRRAGNWREWIKLSGEFHLKLIEANNNTILSGYLQTLIARTSLLIGLYEIPKQDHCALDEHRAILDAIERGDELQAVQLMQHHLEEYAHILLQEPLASTDVDLIKIFAK